MRLTFDWTEDEPSDCGGPSMVPSPSSLFMDGDDVVIALREVELRMNFLQFEEFVEACNAWRFRDCRGEREIDDENHIPAEEHQKLRKFIRGMLDTGKVGRAEIPQEILDAMTWELSTVATTSWRSQEERIRLLLEDAKDLREQLRLAKKARRIRSPAGG